MHILLDAAGLTRVYFHRSQRVAGELRHYYLSEPPALALLVSRAGSLADLAGHTVDALVGYERGVDGFCVPGYVGTRHGKLTIIRPVVCAPGAQTWERTLTEFLDETYTDAMPRKRKKRRHGGVS